MSRITLALAAAALVLAAPAAWPSGAADSTTTHVHISGFAFDEASVTIEAGDAIEWDNHDAFSHTATADGGEFDSGVLENGESYSFTFANAGTFTYYCAVHTSMTGEIVVTPPPNAAPSVAIAAPADGATVTATFTLSGTASDADGAVERVEVAIDGGAWTTADGTASWSHDVDSATLTNGAHTLSARAYDGADYSPVASITVHADDPLPPNTPPTVRIESPEEGDVVTGTITVTGSASNVDGAIERVEVAVDGGPYQAADGTADWSFDVATTALANGEHVFSARAFDGVDYSDVASVGVVVRNLPDLVIDAFGASGGITSRTVHATVVNDGTVAASPVSVSFYYVYEGELHLIDVAESAAPLEAGDSVTLTATWDTLGKIGRFDLVARADEADRVAELDETNNGAVAETVILVGVPGVDALAPLPT